MWPVVYSVFPCIITCILGIITSVQAIDCYKCTSLNGKMKGCEDEFDRGLATIRFIQRKCIYGYFEGTHCIKLKGETEDGTRIMVRDCSNSDWGSHCGDIRFVHDNKEQRLYGCLESCGHDGCNSANQQRPSPLAILQWTLATLLISHILMRML